MRPFPRTRGRSGPERWRQYTVVSLQVFAVFELLLVVQWLTGGTGPVPVAARVAMILLLLGHSTLHFTMVRAAPFLGGQGSAVLPAVHTAVTVLIAGLALGLNAADYSKPAVVGLLLIWVLMCFSGPVALLLPQRRAAALITAVCVAVLVALPLTGTPGRQTWTTVLGAVVGVAVISVSFRASAWGVRLVDQLEEAREAQARLSVAEERLRFSRDLHDVLGRNLSVIALKSELAVQLARRGRPEAADQMAEVQRVAQESQREIRAVVRGYREADLRAELAGARSVMRAAGVDCRVDDATAADLPAPVQSALAWVVREGTTNVLRHADARVCRIELRTNGAAALIMENDGVPQRPGAAREPSGSGLAGLRERLAAQGGVLTAERRPGGRFRLVADVPLGTDGGSGNDRQETR
ncbi:histidine kinase [Streptomyces sp. 7-21]|uniref:sensor histidine kinase n=1 Tax=Streptomyces sp. 7-21 TaxID=2802283 RepID=UPI0027DBE6FA|nr:histidine kinase [Streptomyces sp. 7-21]